MDQRQSLSWDESLDDLKRAASQVMSISSVEVGGPAQAFSVRFRGLLTREAQSAYRILEPPFRQHGLTLWMREEDGDHLILGTPGVIEAEPSNPLINLALFVVTVLSVILAGALYANVNTFDMAFSEPIELSLQFVIEQLPGGIPFAASLMSILLAHEFGHYIAGKIHKTPVTLPYFLPLPGSILGTLGAFIRMKAPPINRRVLLDIGLAGPLAGLLVALPILFIGLDLSPVRELPASGTSSLPFSLEGNSLIYLGAKYIVKGELLPSPVSYGGAAPLAYWTRYFFTGQPIPFGGMDIIIHPLVWAGWAGLLVTALNLIPVGQLDGGHLLYGLLGKRAGLLWPAIIVILVGMGFIWRGWWIWAGLVFFLGRQHAPTLDSVTELDGRRKAMALLGLLVFLLTFTPVPLVAVNF